MKTNPITASCLLLASALVLIGCQTQQQRRPGAPAGTVEPSRSKASGGLVSITKSMPREVTLGEEFMYQIDARATESVGNVIITDELPDGLTYVRSEPEGRTEGNRLIWRVDTMEAGDTLPIKVWVKAAKEGSLAACATVSADPRVCAGTFVGRPTLAITKTGPPLVRVGDEITYMIVVSNKGNSVARNVVVTDAVPAGLTHSSGQSALSFNVGDLAPNQSREIPVTFRAPERGKFCNVAVAKSSNAGEVEAEACTTVALIAFKIQKTGPKEQFIGRNAAYKIVVSNEGDIDIPDLVVTDSAPAQTSIVSAPGANISGNTATWQVPNLAKGENRTFEITLTASTAGNHCNVATASQGFRGMSQSSEACTLWRGVSGLLLQTADDPDPIQVGETTSYRVRVTNQGTADDTNVKVVVEFPAQVTPVSADGGGQVQGRTVTFPPFPRLAPKQVFEYQIQARGAEAGDARIRFIRTSDGIPAPTTSEESTRVY